MKPHLNAHGDSVFPGQRAAANPVDSWPYKRDRSTCCETCAWWRPKWSGVPADRYEKEPGHCRRHAPALSSDEGWPTKGWPVSLRQDWCGDHKLDEEKLR